MKNLYAFLLAPLLVLLSSCRPGQNGVEVTINADRQLQTMHSFGASDCWRTKYIGLWPEDKKQQMANLLFSLELDENGNPKGIGLSMWRFNIGSGTHEAGERGGVKSDWRRTECFLDAQGNWDWSKQAGQRWFLQAAKERGVPYTLGFSIAAPTFMSKNGMARASDKSPSANLREDKYDDYAMFMATVSKQLEFDYLSPINEPQWDWTTEGQEGMQAVNQECSRLIYLLNSELQKQQAKTKVVFGEAGYIPYLYQRRDKPERDNQIREIFMPSGKYSISGLPTVAPVVSGHSYWSTWPLDTLIANRVALRDSMAKLLPGYAYWQTEFCPMEKNEDNPHGGGKRDTGMNTALYVARIIHQDLTKANAASWQWWTAFSEWDYKDGLIFVDDGVKTTGASSGRDSMVETCKKDGAFRTSKLLWALGNYSRFVRPGMKRVDVTSSIGDGVEAAKTLMVSAYADEQRKKIALVFVNMSDKDYPVKLKAASVARKFQIKFLSVYETSESADLAYRGKVVSKVVVPARSVVTLAN